MLSPFGSDMLEMILISSVSAEAVSFNRLSYKIFSGTGLKYEEKGGSDDPPPRNLVEN